MSGSSTSACARGRICENDARGTAWRTASRGRCPARILRDSIWREPGQRVLVNGRGEAV